MWRNLNGSKKCSGCITATTIVFIFAFVTMMVVLMVSIRMLMLVFMAMLVVIVITCGGKNLPVVSEIANRTTNINQIDA